MPWRTALALGCLFASIANLAAQPGPMNSPGLPGMSPPGKLPALPGVTTLSPTTPVVSTPSASAAGKTGLVSFEPTTVQVRWVSGRWQLQAGDQLLKDFGARENDAREALNLIRKLQLTQRGTIGQPMPIMEYWLANGKAPVSLTGSMRVAPIDQGTLRAEQIQGHWCVRDDKRILFNFGSLKQEAQQAVEVIRRHEFTQIGHIGQPQTTMIYFLGGKNGVTSSGFNVPSITSQIAKNDKTAAPAAAPNTATDLNPVLLQQMLLLSKGMHQLAPPPLGNVTPIRLDPHQLVLKLDGAAWKLFHGQYLVANFGPHKDHAVQAQQVLQFYGCDEQRLIGQPEPTFSYFLTKGHAPLGVRHDLQGRQFQTDNVTVKQIQQNWYVCDGDRPMLFFGDRKEDAKQLIQDIKRYRFDFVSQIGPPDQPAMSILVRSR